MVGMGGESSTIYKGDGMVEMEKTEKASQLINQEGESGKSDKEQMRKTKIIVSSCVVRVIIVVNENVISMLGPRW